MKEQKSVNPIGEPIADDQLEQVSGGNEATVEGIDKTSEEKEEAGAGEKGLFFKFKKKKKFGHGHGHGHGHHD